MFLDRLNCEPGEQRGRFALPFASKNDLLFRETPLFALLASFVIPTISFFLIVHARRRDLSTLNPELGIRINIHDPQNNAMIRFVPMLRTYRGNKKKKKNLGFILSFVLINIERVKNEKAALVKHA